MSFNLEGQKANPDLYYPLSPKWENLELQGYTDRGHAIFFDKETGEKYYQIQMGEEGQQFVSLILKGVIPVSDVVTVVNDDAETLYLSREINTQDYQTEVDTLDARASTQLLKIIFCDSDHIVSKKNPHNIQFTDGKFVIYDLHQAAWDFLDSPFFDKNLEATKFLSLELLQKLKSKLEAFEKQITGSEGRRFASAVYQKVFAEATIDDNAGGVIFNGDKHMEFDDVYALLLGRLHMVLSTVESRLNKRMNKKK